MDRLNDIHNYLIQTGEKEDDIVSYDKSSFTLSKEIMEYAHRNQKRVNGENYSNHPSRCLKNYQNLLNINPDNNSSINKDILKECNIPYEGVQEVCLLHDVLEDSDFTVEELEEIFDKCNHGDYFRSYIKTPLINITHIKNIDYPSYINICMENPTSAICKMMDLQDNIYILSLIKFDEKKYKRAQDYLSYFYLINSKYKFIENASKYRNELINKNKSI